MAPHPDHETAPLDFDHDELREVIALSETYRAFDELTPSDQRRFLAEKIREALAVEGPAIHETLDPEA